MEVEKMEQLSLDINGMNNIILTDRQTDRPPQTLAEKIEKAQNVLKLAAEMSKIYYGKPLIITYSGGKDSDVLLHLSENCLNPDDFEVLNGHTTVDAPQTVYHIRETFKRLNEKGIKTTIDYHKKANGTNLTMWNLIIDNQIPPTRIARYCCAVLKESTTPNRMCAVGVRASESTNRKGRDVFSIRGKTKKDAYYYSLSHVAEVHKESQEIQDDNWDCTFIKTMKEHKDTVVNPIYEWEDEDIWKYIKEHSIKMNPLYSMGYERVGCIGCPLANHHQRIKQFNDFPKYKQMYINAFSKMLNVRKKNGKDDINGKDDYHRWRTGEDVFEWWMENYKRMPKGQMSLFEENE
jgi:phosphoadenosine phosphosulfate reductase